MSDRRPTDDELLLEALEAARAGNGAAAAAESRLAHDKGLQAEFAGLKAVQELLKSDAAWGEQSGADVPPPHLLDAILRAELAARPDAIRSAVASSSTVGGAVPAAPAAGWWARFSSWVVGGGVVVGAAAAVLLTVSRAPADVAAPKAESAPAQAAAPATTAPALPVVLPEAPPGTGAVDVLAGERLAATEGRRERNELEKKKNALATAMPAEASADKADKAAEADRSIGGGLAAGADGGGGLAPGAASGAMAGPRASGRGDAAPDADDAVLKDALQPPAEMEAAPPPPAAEPTPSPRPADPDAASTPAAAPPPPKPVRVVSALEAQQRFLAARAKADAKEQAVEEAKGKAKSEAAGKKSARKAAREDADEAREQMARDQRLQEANGVLVTAERELQFGRFAVALDLAQRAEASAGGGLGLAPASTQTRAYMGLKRPADAARVASRLLQGSAALPQLVDGMLAGAEAAIAIGDVRLAERLLQKAASAENPDAARRAEAQRRLRALSGSATAPAKARANEASSPAAAASDEP